jgi:hypothetical protein
MQKNNPNNPKFHFSKKVVIDVGILPSIRLLFLMNSDKSFVFWFETFAICLTEYFPTDSVPVEDNLEERLLIPKTYGIYKQKTVH